MRGVREHGGVKQPLIDAKRHRQEILGQCHVAKLLF
jgi:hypothetical protein